MQYLANKRLKERAKKAQKETVILTKNLSNKAFLEGANERKQALKIEHENIEAQNIIDQYKNHTPDFLSDENNKPENETVELKVNYSDIISKKMKEHSKTGKKHGK